MGDRYTKLGFPPMFFRQNPFRSASGTAAADSPADLRFFQDAWQENASVQNVGKPGALLEAHTETLRRVANFVISAEFILNPRLTSVQLQEREDQFFQLMVSGDFLPSPSLLANAGREGGQLAAACVLPV